MSKTKEQILQIEENLFIINIREVSKLFGLKIHNFMMTISYKCFLVLPGNIKIIEDDVEFHQF